MRIIKTKKERERNNLHDNMPYHYTADGHGPAIEVAARTFWVQRDEDMSGMSGTGIVADGVQFPDGTTAVRWRELPKDAPNYVRGVRATTVVFPNVEAVEALHGHNGATHLVWHDTAV